MAQAKSEARQRSPAARHISLDQLLAPEKPVDLERLDLALDSLAIANPDAAKVVELRYFAGLSAAESAAAMGVCDRTAQRYGVYAKAWLLQELQD